MSLTQPDTLAPSGTNSQGHAIVRCFSQSDLDAALTQRGVEIWLCGTGKFQLLGAVVARATDKSHVVALGSSHVEAWESSHVEARESSHVVALGSSHVEARESSHVVALGSSHVEALGSSHVVALGSSHVVAWGSSHVEARESSHVVAWESSHVVALESSHVVAWGSSHVEAWGSSHVEAWGSSHVVAWGSSHVEAWGSSHVEAWGSSHVEARESSRVVASKCVAVHRHSKLSTVAGGVVIEIVPPTSAHEWCEWHGVQSSDGVATVYKGVRDDYCSARGVSYAPGAVPVAPDWDGGSSECGGGLHFSPTASATKAFDSKATKFLACQVRLSDMRAPKPDDHYPNKIKAAGCCAPCVEVDIYGRVIHVDAEDAR